jgi:tetratricopeptide (TPR) repeat protein
VRSDLNLQLRAVQLDRNDMALRRGDHGRLLADLSVAAAAQPLDERLAGQLMLALYRCGRQADALDVYHRVRMRLADDLGTDPSPSLRQLYQRVLAADPELAAPMLSPTRRDPQQPPRQLPAPPRSFAGRLRELAHLDAVLNSAGEPPTTALIAVLSGTAGIGKTALAVHWAHRVAGRFPDGQLYVNLRGFDPGRQSMTPGEAISGLLNGLGVPPHRIPVDLDAQTALYRSALTGRRMLIVADNARDAAHVRPLLPGAAGCLVLVTSRSQLSGLVAVDGAHPITLDLLSTAEAHELLAGRLEESRLTAQPGAVDDIIAGCARLPLALAMVAARAATHPGFGLDALAKELHEARRRLDAFADGEDATIDIRAVFSWSYQRLSVGAARLFRLLGLTPGPDLTDLAAASITGMPPGQVRPLLAELTRVHLIVEHTPGRYTFHDLLRAYAVEQTHTHDSDADRHTAVGRVLDHYLSSAAAATEALHPRTPHRTPAVTAPATPSAKMGDRTAARAWLDTERANLVAACRYAADHGWMTHGTDLTRVLTRYLDTGGHYTDAFDLHTTTRQASRRAGNPAGEAHALTFLGLALFRRGELGPAAEHLRAALSLSRQVGDHAAESGTLIFLGMVCWRRGELGPAAEHLHHALDLSRQLGDRTREALALTYLGAVCWRRGELGPAAEHLHHALDLGRQLGDPANESQALAILGAVYWRRGELGPAAEHLHHALDLSREVGNPADEAGVLALLGGVLFRRGELGPATEHLHRALDLSRKVGDRAAEALALTVLGGVLLRRGELRSAAEHLHQALAVCRQVDNRAEEDSVLTTLGVVRGQQGDHDLAVEHLELALSLARQVGDRATEANALTALGLVHGKHGERAPAIAHLQQALHLSRQIGARATEADALDGLGETLRIAGAMNESRAHHTRALTVATEIDNPDVKARAHDGIAIAHHANGNLDQARQHWQDALMLYTRLDLPDAKRIRANLSRLPPTL